MRILYLSQLIPYPVNAGPKVRIYHVLQHLHRAGHEVTLLAFARPDDEAPAIAHMGQFCQAVHTVPMVRSRRRDGWHLARSVLTGQPFLIARDNVPAMHQAITRLLAAGQFDAVHADQLWMAQYALAARRMAAGQNGRSPRLVLDQHNAVYLIPQRLAESMANPLARLFLRREAAVMRRYEQATCRQFDVVVWVTGEDRQALSAAHLNGPVIPICVDPQSKPVINRPPGGRRVTFLGGLHWPPNAAGVLWFVREVWPLVLAEAPDACLTIIGKDPPAELMDWETAVPNLEITGYVPDPAPYLAETAAFIVPLHAGGGMRVKIVDAWSWGLPIVTTTIGTEGLRHENGANLLLADSPVGFAQAILRLLRDPGLAQQLGRAGRRTIEQHYNWRTAYRAWDEIYQPELAAAS